MINLIADTITPRLTYVVEAINQRSCEKWNLTTERAAEKPKVFYTNQPGNAADYNIDIGTANLLFLDQKPAGNSMLKAGKIYLGENPLEIFEVIFWSLSRYEEYNFKAEDPHGRFGFNDTCLNEDRVEQPWIDQSIIDLENEVLAFYKQKPSESDKSVDIIPTFDIDNAYAFKHKSFMINAAGFMKDLLRGDDQRLRFRLATLIMGGKDPYDTHEQILKIMEKKPGYVFFLFGNRSKYDKNLPWSTTALQKLVQQYDNKAKTGIHPSYKSNKSEKKLHKEIKRLETVTGQKVNCSRQHFLKFHFPLTAHRLLDNGIREDHTMLFYDRPGFRAGTAYPFSFFDFDENQSTALTFHPVVYMDGSFADYMDIDLQEAIEKVQTLHANMKNTGGNFECIWHNETIANFGRWKGWKKLLEETLAL